MKLLSSFPRTHAKGFTLIELMTVLAIAGVLMVLAAPSFSNLVKSQRLRTAASELYSDMTFARSEALNRRATVSITPLDTAAEGSKDWANGWKIVLGTAAAGTTVLKIREAFEGNVSAPGGTSVEFGLAGRPIASTISKATFKHPDLPEASWRCIQIEPSGRPTNKEGKCP